jgi:hypothetical protein
VSESGKKHHTVRAGRDAVSAVQLSQSLTAAIDQWAEARQINRSDAIRQLVELGLRASPVTPSHARHDVLEIEDEAISLLRKLLDPVLSIEEREWRIRRPAGVLRTTRRPAKAQEIARPATAYFP